MANEVEQRALARYLEDHHLKHTKQREAILDVFLSLTGHTTSESLYQRVRALHSNIGYTTVYRTMKLLCEAGLAQEASFDGITRYEIAHDIEFECEMIEGAQQNIAKRYGFRVLRHRHELYGHCSDCQNPR
jgi:Fur family ferric uptake transcriptional regulator